MLPKMQPILEQSRCALNQLVESEKLLQTDVSVLAKALTPEEAIGRPGRRDFPIITGKERLIEATVLGSKGQAFTDAPREFVGSIAEALALELDSNQNRAIFVATLNALLGHLGCVTGTVHCRDEEPEQCGGEIARTLFKRYGRANVGLVGLNPAIAENLVDVFGSGRIRITDLYSQNIGQERFGVPVWDGHQRTLDLVKASDVILFTGTTLQNDTFDPLWKAIQTHQKIALVYGVTAAGVCKLAGIERICPLGRPT